MKKTIGLIPYAHLFENDDPHDDSYIFVNNYCVRIAKNGGVPIGILAVDGKISEEAILNCDSVIICGGNRIFPYHFQAVEYAIKNNKRLLGICLGMQVIHTYFVVEDEAKKRSFNGELIELYEIMKKEKYMFTLPVKHHWDVKLKRNKENEAKHNVKIIENTNLQRITSQNYINAATMHNYKINNPSERLKICAMANDGTIEAIEYGQNILGIQFHPEVDDELSEFFKWIVYEI